LNKPPIVLLTDFGDSHYAGQLRGVIATLAPGAVVIDLAHSITPQDIVQGALVLKESVAAFPHGSIFVCVVDPGVGTTRRGLVLLSGGRVFVGPDNGILYPVAGGRADLAVELANEKYFRPVVSNTFHGRDIFSPVAAHLWNGVPVESMGPAVSDIVPLDVPVPVVTEGRIDGRVLYTDRFGNLVTNIDADALSDGEWTVLFKGRRIKGISGTYADRGLGALVALKGSGGRLEIAVSGGSVVERLHVKSPKSFRVRAIKRRG
jgi:S-adenosylmethionine hydrolase